MTSQSSSNNNIFSGLFGSLDSSAMSISTDSEIASKLNNAVNNTPDAENTSNNHFQMNAEIVKTDVNDSMNNDIKLIPKTKNGTTNIHLENSNPKDKQYNSFIFQLSPIPIIHSSNTSYISTLEAKFKGKVIEHIYFFIRNTEDTFTITGVIFITLYSGDKKRHLEILNIKHINDSKNLKPVVAILATILKSRSLKQICKLESPKKTRKYQEHCIGIVKQNNYFEHHDNRFKHADYSEKQQIKKYLAKNNLKYLKRALEYPCQKDVLIRIKVLESIDYFNLRNFHLAQECYTQALKSLPATTSYRTHSSMLYDLGLCKYASYISTFAFPTKPSKHLPLFEKPLKKSLRIYPNNIKSCELLGLIPKTPMRLALHCLQRAVKLGTHNPKCYFKLSVLERKFHLSNAYKHIHIATNTSNSPECDFTYAQWLSEPNVKANSGTKKLALFYYMRTVENSQNCKIYKQNSILDYIYNKSHLHQFEILINSITTFPTHSKGMIAHFNELEGLSLVKLDIITEARFYLAVAIHQDPSNQNYRYRYGKLLLHLGNDKAIDIFEKLVVSSPFNGKYYDALSRAKFSFNEPVQNGRQRGLIEPNLENAVSNSKIAIILDKKQSRYYYDNALQEEQTGNISQSIKSATQATKLAPNNIHYQLYLNHLKRGYISYDENTNYIEKLNKMIGLDNVKKEVKMLVSQAYISELRTGVPGHQEIHLVFEGNPGTGKTTVANLLCNILYQSHVIQSHKVIAINATQLISSKYGISAKRIRKYIQEAMGGVLFIDEAYELRHRSDGNSACQDEVMNEFVPDIDKYRNNLVVIIAGYTKNMEQLLNKSNPGLKSRFPLRGRIRFHDYTPTQCMKILSLYLKEHHFAFATPKARNDMAKALRPYIQYCTRNHEFGNGRTMRNIYNELTSQLSLRMFQSNTPKQLGYLLKKKHDRFNLITEQDVQQTIQVLESKEQNNLPRLRLIRKIIAWFKNI